jgi:hypothetical protein
MTKIIHPGGKDRENVNRVICHEQWVAGESRNHRFVIRYQDVNGVIQTYRIFGYQKVRMNRLPRGSKRRTGVWNGQVVADMVHA